MMTTSVIILAGAAALAIAGLGAFVGHWVGHRRGYRKGRHSQLGVILKLSIALEFLGEAIAELAAAKQAQTRAPRETAATAKARIN